MRRLGGGDEAEQTTKTLAVRKEQGRRDVVPVVREAQSQSCQGMQQREADVGGSGALGGAAGGRFFVVREWVGREPTNRRGAGGAQDGQRIAASK